jgi:hypothetical protein
MIPRLQRIVYYTLVACIVVMAIILAVSRSRDHARIAASRDQSPIAAPSDIPNEQASLAIPLDDDGSIRLDQKSLALPPDPSTRARVLLTQLFASLALPGSTHPVPAGPAILDVFFVPLPIRNPAATTTDQATSTIQADPSYGIQLAIINLAKPFADQHASGIEAEDLTLRAIVATLHANFPQIAQVRFLVDGQTRATLAGHADLTRPYSVQNSDKSIHAVLQGDSPY